MNRLPILHKATLLVLTSLVSLTSLAETNLAPSRVEKLFQQTRPLVIAHRGYSAFAPENSLPALDLGVRSGADLVELDYHHSSDGVPIVIHDFDLDRTTDSEQRWQDKKIRVDAKTADQLRTLDAGQWFNPPVAGLHLPTLKEALQLIQKSGVTLIERKAGDAKTCVALMREMNLINQAMVQAFDWEYLEDFHRLEQAQILGALGPPARFAGKELTREEKKLSPEWNERVARIGAKAVVWNSQIDAEAVKDAQARGLKVWVYTIDDPKKAEELLAMGVDGIITNNPSILWRTIALFKR